MSLKWEIQNIKYDRQHVLCCLLASVWGLRWFLLAARATFVALVADTLPWPLVLWVKSCVTFLRRLTLGEIAMCDSFGQPHRRVSFTQELHQSVALPIKHWPLRGLESLSCRDTISYKASITPRVTKPYQAASGALGIFDFDLWRLS